MQAVCYVGCDSEHITKDEPMKQSNLVTQNTVSRDGVPGVITYGLQYLEGNSDAYFTLTAEYKGKDHDGRKQEFCGCCHEDILAKNPDLEPFKRLHLSESTGVPMHAEANGWYWLAGALGGLGEQYHGWTSTPNKGPEECLSIFADHARITLEEARALADKVLELHKGGAQAKLYFHDWIEAQKPRWAKEAQDAIALIEKAKKSKPVLP